MPVRATLPPPHRRLPRGSSAAAGNRTRPRDRLYSRRRTGRIVTPLVEALGLSKHFPVRSGSLLRRQTGAVQAVDDVNLQILPGETLGLVGESGCGKSTLGRLLIRLVPPTGGQILFDGNDITGLKGVE